MKIALITNLCTHYRYKLFKLLSEKYNFDFYFFDNKEKTKEDIAHLTVYKDDTKFNYIPTRKILQKLLKNKYDVIIKCTNNKWSFLGSFIIAKLTRAKFIVWHSIWYYPDTLQYKLFSWLLIKILKDWTDAIVVYGEHGKKFLVEKGINPEKIFIAWQTVDNELYGRKVHDEETEKLKKDLNIYGKKVIIYVGRLVKLKGLEYLLQALKSINRKDFVFLMVGDGNLRSYIENFCLENRIDYRITGLIPFSKLPPYYKIADVLVLPSITTKTFKEPWGLVINEAFNQGCPVVVTDAVGAGVGGLVKDKVNGLVVPEKNEGKLAEAIEKILFDDELKENFSKNALEEIKKWTYERQAGGFLEAVNYALRGKIIGRN
jgi:glycosyltransferase involved in cell wall biosynthesis